MITVKIRCPNCDMPIKEKIKEYYRLRYFCQFTGKEKTMWMEK